MILKISSCASNVNLVDSCARAVTMEEAKKSPNQETVLGNRGPLEALNDTKLKLNSCSFGIFQNLQMSPIPQTSFLVWAFFLPFLTANLL